MSTKNSKLLIACPKPLSRSSKKKSLPTAKKMDKVWVFFPSSGIRLETLQNIKSFRMYLSLKNIYSRIAARRVRKL
jgi:hypothetical protein